MLLVAIRVSRTAPCSWTPECKSWRPTMPGQPSIRVLCRRLALAHRDVKLMNACAIPRCRCDCFSVTPTACSCQAGGAAGAGPGEGGGQLVQQGLPAHASPGLAGAAAPGHHPGAQCCERRASTGLADVFCSPGSSFSCQHLSVAVPSGQVLVHSYRKALRTACCNSRDAGGGVACGIGCLFQWCHGRQSPARSEQALMAGTAGR
jgi:hypothetical protein